MKKIFLIAVTSALLILSVNFIIDDINDNRTLAQEEAVTQNDSIEVIATVVQYDSFEKLTGESELVVAVKVKDEAEVIDYENATFTKNQVEIQDVILGDGQLKGTNVAVLELGDISKGDQAVLQPGKEYLLFLQTYEGPITSDAYVVTGMYQGKFKLKEGKLSFNFKPTHPYHEELRDLTLNEVKEKIKQNQ